MRPETVSHYHIVDQLGAGGMGVVYKAVDSRLGRVVALKFLPADRPFEREATLRLYEEARTASALDHPNICTVHEIDETEDGRLFLAMTFYDGETLSQRAARGPLPIAEALDMAAQVASGLAKAHAAGIVHRDIKPANLMITRDGVVKILDFGIAKSSTQPDLTRTGAVVGTLAYMAPERLNGLPIDARADLWSLGVVIYEMVTGRRPFPDRDPTSQIAAILHDHPSPLGALRPGVPSELEGIVMRALAKDRDARYASAGEMLGDLRACRDRTVAAPAVARMNRGRRAFMWGIAVALVAAVAGAGWLWRDRARAQYAREELLPEIKRLAGADAFVAAYNLALEAERHLPSDPALSELWPAIAAEGAIKTAPSAADVRYREYGTRSPTWMHAGQTPLHRRRLPKGVFEWRIEKAGFEPLAFVSANPGAILGNQDIPGDDLGDVRLELQPAGTIPDGMVYVPGSRSPVHLNGFALQFIDIPPFFLDKYEVTNREFKAFIIAGGYTNERFWSGLPFTRDGRQQNWREAVAKFVDTTGRPGPSTWELGDYPPGQDDFPVSGVSWFEAAAYARFRDKALPTLYHWAFASTSYDNAHVILPASQFGARGPRPAGHESGMTAYGAFDMPGNVREWVWNAWGDARWILGGAWDEPPYMGTMRNHLSPFDRSATNGFRCMQPLSSTPIADALLAPRSTAVTDFRTAKPVSAELLDAYAKNFAYHPGPLNARVESVDDTHKDYIRQRISFDSGYGERTPLQLLLPRGAARFRTVVFFPGTFAFQNPGHSDQHLLRFVGPEEFVVKSGMALAFPIYYGSYERWQPAPAVTGPERERYRRSVVARRRQDLGRTVDYLQTRSEVVADRLIYLAFSQGAAYDLLQLALEPRFGAAILVSGGVGPSLPELQPLNYAPRMRLPVLMLNGRYDHIFPLETSQKPLFNNLGSPAEHKRHVVYEAGHYPLPKAQWVPEAMAWIDKYAPR